MRDDRPFLNRPEFERQHLLEHTWCDACEKPDLGMHSPREYEENGLVYVEGLCNRCGQTVRSEIIEQDAE